MTEKFEEDYALPIKTWVLDCGFRGPDSDFAISEADALGLWWGSVDLERVSTITTRRYSVNSTLTLTKLELLSWVIL